MHIGGDGLKCQELTQALDSYGMAEGEGEGTSGGGGRRVDQAEVGGCKERP